MTAVFTTATESLTNWWYGTTRWWWLQSKIMMHQRIDGSWLQSSSQLEADLFLRNLYSIFLRTCIGYLPTIRREIETELDRRGRLLIDRIVSYSPSCYTYLLSRYGCLLLHLICRLVSNTLIMICICFLLFTLHIITYYSTFLDTLLQPYLRPRNIRVVPPSSPSSTTRSSSSSSCSISFRRRCRLVSLALLSPLFESSVG